MGQTLTHGVYLPAEGERNCYDGLASNWNILDGAVGTIAEHTTALAGKAPAVHTHTKSDVTDLLNSNFIPSANNSYDLGSSSYQWNNVYSKGYYYNGVAWGLDKENTWTGRNVFIGAVILPTFGSSNYKNYGIVTAFGYKQYNNFYSFFRTTGAFGTDNTPDTSNPSFLTLRPHDLKTELMDNVVACNNGTNNYLAPITNNATDLGTSTNKWKSLNGINPGALSIFNPSATQDPIDVPNTWVTDGSAWNTLNVSNMGDGWIIITYTRCSDDDYILVRFGGTSGSTYPSMLFKAEILSASGTFGFMYAFFPVAKAMGNIYLEMRLDSNAVLTKHHFIPAYGTV